MVKLMIDELTPGMTLEEAVKNANGTVLIPSEVDLSEKHIRALKMWGIVAVAVKSDAQQGAGSGGSMDPALLEKAKEAIKSVFVHANTDHPVMAEIFKQAAIRHARSS